MFSYYKNSYENDLNNNSYKTVTGLKATKKVKNKRKSMPHSQWGNLIRKVYHSAYDDTYLEVPQGFNSTEKDRVDNKYPFSKDYNCEPKYNFESSFEGKFYGSQQPFSALNSSPFRDSKRKFTNPKASNKYTSSAPKNHWNKTTQKCPESVLRMKPPNYSESIDGFHNLSPYNKKAPLMNPFTKPQSSASQNLNPLLKLTDESLFRTRELPISSDDYTTVLKAFYNNKRPSANFKVEIHEIGFRNREQHDRLRLLRNRGTPNMLVFHGTKGCNVPGILHKGFRASKQGDSVGDYGPGVYTTNFGSYAEQYSYDDGVQYVFVGEVADCHEMSIRNIDDRRLHRINKSAGMAFKGFEKIIGHNTNGFDSNILKVSDRRYFELTTPNDRPFYVKPNSFGLAQPEYDEFRVDERRIFPAFLIIKTRL